MSAIPVELLRMRVFGGTSAVDERKFPEFIPSNWSPIRAAQFESGQPVTAEMIQAAEALSAKYRKRRAR